MKYLEEDNYKYFSRFEEMSANTTPPYMSARYTSDLNKGKNNNNHT